jgi:hypothetical protein
MPGNRDRNKTTAGVTREQVEDLIDSIWAFDIRNPNENDLLVYRQNTGYFVNETVGDITISYGNLDGGVSSSTYQAVFNISGGTSLSVF